MLLGRKAIGGAAAGLSLLTAGGVVVLLGPDSALGTTAPGTTATGTDAARSSTTVQTLTNQPSASVPGVSGEAATSVPASATDVPFATAPLTPGPAASTSSTRVRSAADRAAARRLTSQRTSVGAQRTTTTSDRGGVTTKPTTSTTSPVTTRTTTRPTTRTTSGPTASSRTTSSSNGGSSASYEATLLALVNAERTSRGLPALIAARCPDTFAESWASRLVKSGAFEHQSLSPIMSSCGASRAAENIARGNISAAAMVKLWMGSPGHRANILDAKLTHVGTAAVRDASGTWTAVQDFIRP